MFSTCVVKRFLATKKPPKQGRINTNWQRIKTKFNEIFFPEECKPLSEPVCKPDSCAVDPKWKQPRVIIVGAGMAGLSAAQRLLQCGISNFLILEATNRPGGRIQSLWMGDCITEHGAMWIEGACIANVIFRLATQEGLIGPILERVKVAENSVFTTPQGRTIDRRTVESAVLTFDDIIKGKAVLEEIVGKHKSLGEFLQINLTKVMNSLAPNFRNDIDRCLGCLYNELRNHLGQDPCLIRANALSEKGELPGGRIRIPLGFGNVLSPLLRILPPCSIVYCKPVHYIAWEVKATEVRAKVVCSDKQEFDADYVIITVPLGVLKQDIDTMFIPELPKRKKQAIERLGFADVEKVFFQYEQPFWGTTGGIGLGWALNELTKDSSDWTRGLGELTCVPSSNATLQGTVSANAAVVLSMTPSDRLIPRVGSLMRQFTGNNTLPDPIAVQRSNWIRDPFFGGSFTYLGLTSDPCHFDDLAEPIPNPKDLTDANSEAPLLLFAGEATSRHNFATVHGARESGIREAQRIIELTNVYQGPPVCRAPCPPCP